ncbi:MAG: putative toxin-antitoxin system toxin component, PIN family [Candidatus Omnitrophota bacterium]
MTIVFDSNVIISAFITTTGPTKDVFLYCGERYRVITSEYIINEVCEKLCHKLGFSKSESQEVRTFLYQNTEVVESSFEVADFSRDKKDNPVIALALFVKADLLITGDKDLLSLKKVDGVKIIRPAEFWNEIRQVR